MGTDSDIAFQPYHHHGQPPPPQAFHPCHHHGQPRPPPQAGLPPPQQPFDPATTQAPATFPQPAYQQQQQQQFQVPQLRHDALPFDPATTQAPAWQQQPMLAGLPAAGATQELLLLQQRVQQLTQHLGLPSAGQHSMPAALPAAAAAQEMQQEQEQVQELGPQLTSLHPTGALIAAAPQATESDNAALREPLIPAEAPFICKKGSVAGKVVQGYIVINRDKSVCARVGGKLISCTTVQSRAGYQPGSKWKTRMKVGGMTAADWLAEKGISEVYAASEAKIQGLSAAAAPDGPVPAADRPAFAARRASRFAPYRAIRKPHRQAKEFLWRAKKAGATGYLYVVVGLNCIKIGVSNALSSELRISTNERKKYQAVLGADISHPLQYSVFPYSLKGSGKSKHALEDILKGMLHSAGYSQYNPEDPVSKALLAGVDGGSEFFVLSAADAAIEACKKATDKV